MVVGQNRCSSPEISRYLSDRKGKGGRMRKWYQDEYVGGYIDEAGHLHVCEEYGLSDADTGRYSTEVQNHDGYYDASGKYVSFGNEG